MSDRCDVIPRPEPRVPRWPAAAMVGVFLAIAAALWASGIERGRAAFDQKYYHLPAIRQFASELPDPYLVDYRSATTPGYHLLLAVVARTVTDRPLVLRVLASGFALALLWILTRELTRRAVRRGLEPVTGAVLALPVALTPYVLFPGVWLQPDDAGWLGVLLVLLLALREPPACVFRRGRRLLLMGLVCLGLVTVRQSHLWAAGLVWAAAWLWGAPLRDDTARGLLIDPARRLGWLAVGVLATLPAFGLVKYFYELWGHSLTPPMFKHQVGAGPNPATPAFCLALIGVYSVFFAGWLRAPLLRLWRERRPVLVLAIVAGVGVAAAPETTYLRGRLPDGTPWEPRATGVWNVVRAMDARGLTIAGRTSPLILALSGLGAVAACGWAARVGGRARWVLLAALAGFIAAQTASALAWQRYVEPLLLMVLALAAVSGYRDGEDLEGPGRVPAWAGPARSAGPLLLAGLVALTGVYLLITGEALPWPAPGEVAPGEPAPATGAP